jgi:hypothetical protein
LEFGADDAFILHPDGDDDGETVKLKHLKARHGEARDILLSFDKSRQRFSPVATELSAADRLKIRSALASLWKSTPTAREDEVDE